jgi:hypothetical protein
MFLFLMVTSVARGVSCAGPYLNGSFDSVMLPLGAYRMDLIDTWRMVIAPTTEAQTVAELPPLTATGTASGAPPGWGAIKIEVNDDSLPHITTFTKL